MKTYLTTFLAIIFFAFMTASCTDHNQEPDASSKTYVLVHGAWQAPFVWDDVKGQLEKQGHRVIVVGLPAHGEDFTSPKMVSMTVYRDKVVDAIGAIEGKVILVGHSLGGLVVTATAEKIPDRIEKLIYIAGYVPANGQSLLDLANQDPESLLSPSIRPSADMSTLDVVHEEITNIFLQDGSDAIKALLLAKFRVEPAMPFGEPVAVTAGNFGKVDKYYIHTALDHAIGPKLQKKMVDAAGITKEYTLQSSHSPFLSIPDQVGALLLAIGKL